MLSRIEGLCQFPLFPGTVTKEYHVVIPTNMKLLLASLLATSLLAQAPPSSESSATKPAPEEGIPVTDQLVISKCGTCHTKDDKGDMLRISFVRATPEQWEEAIKRMV